MINVFATRSSNSTDRYARAELSFLTIKGVKHCWSNIIIILFNSCFHIIITTILIRGLFCIIRLMSKPNQLWRLLLYMAKLYRRRYFSEYLDLVFGLQKSYLIWATDGINKMYREQPIGTNVYPCSNLWNFYKKLLKIKNGCGVP